MLRRTMLLLTVQLVSSLVFAPTSSANAECPTSAPWPCVGSTIDSSTPTPSGGGGTIQFLSLQI